MGGFLHEGFLWQELSENNFFVENCRVFVENLRFCYIVARSRKVEPYKKKLECPQVGIFFLHHTRWGDKKNGGKRWKIKKDLKGVLRNRRLKETPCLRPFH